jgi:tetratricopeptide (TPR) repeat protein
MALKALAPDELQRAYEAVGGHPRTLEYLDALLRGGQAKYPEVERHLRQALRKAGITDPSRWRADTGRTLNRALAEAVTLAADDVLLDGLLTQLDAEPLGRDLLLAASVYSVPVDEVGLQWQVSTEVVRASDPARETRLAKLSEALAKAGAEGRKPDPEALGFAPEEMAQLAIDLAERSTPPLKPAPGLATAHELLADLSLIAPVQHSGEETSRWIVHRWTAAALARRFPEEQLVAAHRRAGNYWRWRMAHQWQSKHQDLLDCLEARFHYHASGEIDAAWQIGQHAVLQLQTWGAWGEAERLIEEMLGWFDAASEPAAACTHTLGNLAFRRGDYDQALDWYHKSLALGEQLGIHAGVASSYHQLGMVAQDRGDYDQALDWYRKALAIEEQLGDRAGMATSLSQIGVALTERGAGEEAARHTLRSLAIRLELKVPQAVHNLRSLVRQRELLGQLAFEEVLRRELDAEVVAAQVTARSAGEAGQEG